MPESRKRKPRRQTQGREPPRLPPHRSSRRLIVGIWIGLLGVATLLGGAAAVVTFLPRLSIDPSGPFAPTKPLTAPFHIANNNFVPLDDGEVDVWVCNVFLRPIGRKIHKCEPDPAAKLANIGLQMSRWKFARISMDNRFDAPIGYVFNITPPAEIYAVDIIVIVTYHPWILPWIRHYALRFYTRSQSDGQLYWLAIPYGTDPVY
jgi:hypothetical protein